MVTSFHLCYIQRDVICFLLPRAVFPVYIAPYLWYLIHSSWCLLHLSRKKMVWGATTISYPMDKGDSVSRKHLHWYSWDDVIWERSAESVLMESGAQWTPSWFLYIISSSFQEYLVPTTRWGSRGINESNERRLNICKLFDVSFRWWLLFDETAQVWVESHFKAQIMWTYWHCC